MTLIDEVNQVATAAGITPDAVIEEALIAATGLRRGEALALRWSDVDMVGGSLKVAGTLSRVGSALERSEPKASVPGARCRCRRPS